MENNRLGLLMIIFSIIFLVFLVYFNFQLEEKSNSFGCNPTDECMSVKNSLSIADIGFGFFGFLFGLGFYILFFDKTEKAILKKLEDEKNQKTGDERFSLIMKALDPFESRVMKAIKEQDGIMQSTLLLRTDMSKAKLSYVLQELEKRKLIKRVSKGKGLAVFLKV